MQHAYDVLDLLEEYSLALSNSDMTLKGIEPIVTRIEQKLKGLDVQSGDNLGQNDGLASIVNEIAVTASVEAFRSQRGDYIAKILQENRPARSNPARQSPASLASPKSHNN